MAIQPPRSGGVPLISPSFLFSQQNQRQNRFSGLLNQVLNFHMQSRLQEDSQQFQREQEAARQTRQDRRDFNNMLARGDVLVPDTVNDAGMAIINGVPGGALPTIDVHGNQVVRAGDVTSRYVNQYQGAPAYVPGVDLTTGLADEQGNPIPVTRGMISGSPTFGASGAVAPGEIDPELVAQYTDMSGEGAELMRQWAEVAGLTPVEDENGNINFERTAAGPGNPVSSIQAEANLRQVMKLMEGGMNLNEYEQARDFIDNSSVTLSDMMQQEEAIRQENLDLWQRMVEERANLASGMVMFDDQLGGFRQYNSEELSIMAAAMSPNASDAIIFMADELRKKGEKRMTPGDNTQLFNSVWAAVRDPAGLVNLTEADRVMSVIAGRRPGDIDPQHPLAQLIAEEMQTGVDLNNTTVRRWLAGETPGALDYTRSYALAESYGPSVAGINRQIREGGRLPLSNHHIQDAINVPGSFLIDDNGGAPLIPQGYILDTPTAPAVRDETIQKLRDQLYGVSQGMTMDMRSRMREVFSRSLSPEGVREQLQAEIAAIDQVAQQIPGVQERARYLGYIQILQGIAAMGDDQITLMRDRVIPEVFR